MDDTARLKEVIDAQEAAGLIPRPNNALMALVFFFLLLGTLFLPGVLAIVLVVMFVWFAGKAVMGVVWK